MPRKARKYYKPHSTESKARIAAGLARYQQRVREALARVASRKGDASCK
jgi:hypothetical protein